jgi:hypothetical protein
LFLFVLDFVTDAGDTDLAPVDLASLAGAGQLHQDIVVAESVDLVEDDDDDAVQLIEDVPKTFVVRRRRDTLVWNPDTSLRRFVEAGGDRLNGLCLGGILRAVDVCKVRRDTLLTSGIDESVGDVLGTQRFSRAGLSVYEDLLEL